MSSNLKVNTILPSTGSNIGIGTNGGELNVDGGCKVQVGTALTIGHSIGLQYATQNLHSAGFEVNQINASGIITATSFSGSGANLTGITGTTINNNANDRIITGSGTANTLNGEANLLFNGTELYPASGIGTAVGHRFNYRRNAPQSRTNTGNAIQQYYKIGEIVLNGSESSEINIYGTQGYSNGAEVAGKTTIVLRATNANTLAGFWYEETLGNANLSDVRWKFSSGQTYELWVKAASYANIAPFVRCTGNGFKSFNYATGDGNAPSGSSPLSSYHRKNVGSVNTIRYNSTDTTFHRNIKMDNGYGIDFGSNTDGGGTASATLLEDYEEGTYTITSNTNLTLDNQRNGYYVKIGNMVTVTGYLSLNTNNGSPSASGTNNIALSLPYAVHTSSGGYTGTMLQQNVDSATPTSLVGHPHWYKLLPVDYTPYAASDGLRFYINKIEYAYERMNNSHLHVGYPGYTYMMWKITYRTT